MNKREFDELKARAEIKAEMTDTERMICNRIEAIEEALDIKFSYLDMLRLRDL